jgi:hypothetical protein
MQGLFESRSEQMPERSAGEKFREAAANAMLAAIPGAGPLAAEFFRDLVGSRFERRRDEWFKTLADGVEEIERRIGRLEAERAVDREEFVTAVYRASSIAIATHREEKHQFLRNALLNAALTRAAGDDEREVFFNAVEVFTPAHVKVLQILRQPLQELERAMGANGPEPHGGARGKPLREAVFFMCPEIGGNAGLLDAILADLRARGFAHITSGDEVFPQATWITNFGIGFLNFISVPPAEVRPTMPPAEAKGR